MSLARCTPVVPLATLLLGGCFTPATDPLIVETVPYETNFTSIDNVVIQPFAIEGLDCPDGSPANFFAVYQTDLTEPAKIVVVFHSGAFDYVIAGQDGVVMDPGAPDARHYQGDVNRLSSDWAADKVFETLGLLGESLDPGETNLGTLPAALVEHGAFSLYPANCWGDLWHNEFGSTPNRYDSEAGMIRNGRYLAWLMTSIASSDPEEAASRKSALGLDALPIDLDSSGVYLAGLGEGGRAVDELYRRVVDGVSATPVRGILLDSTMDNLYPLVTNDTTFKSYNDGLARIYPDSIDDDGDGVIEGDTASGYRDDIRADIGVYSLNRYFAEKPLTIPLAFYYSSADPYLPSATISGILANPFEGEADTFFMPVDTGEMAHVFTNSDMTLAREAVSAMLGE